MQKTRVQPLGWEDPLEKEMATHSSPLAWEIPRTEGPAGPQSLGQQSQTGLSDRHAGLAAGLPRPRRGSQGDIPVGWFPASFPALKTHENRWIKLYYTKALSNHASSLAPD